MKGNNVTLYSYCMWRATAIHTCPRVNSLPHYSLPSRAKPPEGTIGDVVVGITGESVEVMPEVETTREQNLIKKEWSEYLLTAK